MATSRSRGLDRGSLLERALDEPEAHAAFEKLRENCPDEDELKTHWMNAVLAGIRLRKDRESRTKPQKASLPRSKRSGSRTVRKPRKPYDMEPSEIARNARALAGGLARVNASEASPLRWERISEHFLYIRGLFHEQEKVLRAFVRAPRDLRLISAYLEGPRPAEISSVLRDEIEGVVRYEWLFADFVGTYSKRKRWELISRLLAAGYRVAKCNPPLSLEIGALRERCRQFETRAQRQAMLPVKAE
jgi:hypothetical protein